MSAMTSAMSPRRSSPGPLRDPAATFTAVVFVAGLVAIVVLLSEFVG